MQKILTNLIEFFKSKESVLLALLFAVVTQLTHSVTTYIKTDKMINGEEFVYWFSLLIGIFFSLSVSVAIIIFTLRNRIKLAYFFFLVEFVINVIYSGMENPNYQWYNYLYLIFFALIIPTTITAYAHESEREIEKKEDYPLYEDSLDGLRSDFNDLSEVVSSDRKELLEIIGKDKVELLDKLNKPEELLKGKSLKMDVKTTDGNKIYEMKVL
jgi:hypothetical protein